MDVADYDELRPGVAVIGKRHTTKEWLTISDRANTSIRQWLDGLPARCDDEPLFLALHNSRKSENARLSDWSINEMVKLTAKKAGLSRTVTASASATRRSRRHRPDQGQHPRRPGVLATLGR